MFKKSFVLLVATSLFAGCASVPTNQTNMTAQVKQTKAPDADKAGLYIYRPKSFLGNSLKKDVWVDGKCIGETAHGVFFYTTVPGNMTHTVSTESEFSPNDLIVDTKVGHNYFIEQYIKAGVFVGGAGLKLVSEEEGKKAISSLNMGVQGHCSKTYSKK